MGSKREQDPEGVANKRNAIPGQGDDVEGHVANKRTVTEGPEGVANKRNAIPGQEDDDVEGHVANKRTVTEGPEGVANKRNAIPGEEDDVEGHVYTSRRPGDGELTSRKLPGDSPHGES